MYSTKAFFSEKVSSLARAYIPEGIVRTAVRTRYICTKGMADGRCFCFCMAGGPVLLLLYAVLLYARPESI